MDWIVTLRVILHKTDYPKLTYAELFLFYGYWARPQYIGSFFQINGISTISIT